MPRMTSSCSAASVLALLELGVHAQELVTVDKLTGQVLGVALLLDPDLLHHLADDDLDVLVVDVHALRLVDLLDLATRYSSVSVRPRISSSSCG